MPNRLPTFAPPWIRKRARVRAPDARPSASKRGYGSRAWKLARQEALVRDNYQCRACLRVVHGRAAHVDHIVPKSQGGADTLDNLQTLCVSCHSKKEGWKATKHGSQNGSVAKCGDLKNFGQTM